MAGSALPRTFFDRPTVAIARALLGMVVETRGPVPLRVRIVETEAYVAGDPASHAYRGPTRRNMSMFGRPGTLYVYRIHQVVCANVVTRPGEAVLLRAAEPLGPGVGPTDGPGRLCRALGIGIEDDGASLRTGRFRLVPAATPVERISVGVWVGIRRARSRRLRFALRGNRWVSGPRPWGRRRAPRRPVT